MNIVLPNAFASRFEYDFRLFNELKLMVRDEKEKITKEESKKLQMIIDEHLRSSGIEYLLEEPVDISDYENFKNELSKAGQHNPLEKAKSIIKANQEKNPELALELSELLKLILLERKSDRKQAIRDLFEQMEEVIARHKQKHLSVGLESEKQLLVYNLVEGKTESAREFTLALYEVLSLYLRERAILSQSGAQKDMRNAIKPLLVEHGLERKLSKEIVQRLVENA